MDRIDAEDRIHLWEAATTMIRRKMLDGAEDWYYLAKTQLENRHITAREQAAVASFLADQRIFSSRRILQTGEAKTREFAMAMKIHYLATVTDHAQLQQLFDLLTLASKDESFVVREVVADSLATLCSRSEIDDEMLVPFIDQIRTIIETLVKDDHSYVTDSLVTSIRFLKRANLIV